MELFGLLFGLSAFIRLIIIISNQKILFDERKSLMDIIFVFFQPKKYKVLETRRMARILNGLFLSSILCFIILVILQFRILN